MSPDPDAAAWRARTAELRDEVQHQIRHVFEWLDHSLEVGESRGEVAVVLAVVDLDDGKPLSHVLGDLLLSADMWMPCPGWESPACRCGFCTYGRSRHALDPAGVK